MYGAALRFNDSESERQASAQPAALSAAASSCWLLRLCLEMRSEIFKKFERQASAQPAALSAAASSCWLLRLCLRLNGRSAHSSNPADLLMQINLHSFSAGFSDARNCGHKKTPSPMSFHRKQCFACASRGSNPGHPD